MASTFVKTTADRWDTLREVGGGLRRGFGWGMVGGVIEHQSGVPPSLKLRRAGKPQHSTKNPTPRVTGEWGWKVGWFSEAGLLAATASRRPIHNPRTSLSQPLMVIVA